MKLLFDANLSPKLVGRLAELFPESAHVFDVGLAKFAGDEQIWEYAKVNKFVIVTADADFLNIARRCGSPPEVVYLAKCDYRTARIVELLRENAIRIANLKMSQKAILIIRRE